MTVRGVIAWEGRSGPDHAVWGRSAVAALASPTVQIEERDGLLVAVATLDVPGIDALPTTPPVGLSTGMVDPIGQVIRECEDGATPWQSVALTYAFAIRQVGQVGQAGDVANAGSQPGTNFGGWWKPANEAIRKRFATPKDPDGLRALGKVKTLAWDYVEGRKQPGTRA